LLLKFFFLSIHRHDLLFVRLAVRVCFAWS
jgi:hypothetical protein